jgi:hypothetical protein
MKHNSQRVIRAVVLTAACSAVVLALAASAVASNGPNYGNFNPMTGKPDTARDAGINYGGFNPLTGRPDGAAQPAGSPDVPISATPEPKPATQTVIEHQGGQALPIALAGAALLIALAGTGYTVVRVSRLPRPARTR